VVSPNTMSLSPTDAPLRRVNKRRQRPSNAPQRSLSPKDKRDGMIALLAITKEEIARTHAVATVNRVEEPIKPREVVQIDSSAYFLYLFYEPNSFTPRESVDLSGWGEELNSHNLALTMGGKLDQTKCTSLQLQSIVLSDELISWLASFPNLRSLGLARCSRVGPNLPSLVRQCGSLRCLGLSRCGLKDSHLKRFADCAHRRFEEVDLSFNSSLTDEGVDYFASRCDTLKSISLDGLTRLKDAAMVGSVGAGGLLPLHAPRLRRLSIARCSKVGDVSTCGLFEHLTDELHMKEHAFEAARNPEEHRRRHAPKLASLDLSCLPRLTDEGLRPLVDQKDAGTWFVGDLELGRKRVDPVHSVTEVRLAGCPQVSGAGLAYLSYGCPNLVKLDVSEGALFDDKALGALRSLEALRDLTARKNPLVTEHGAQLLLEGSEEEPSEVRRLVHLRLGGCRRLKGGVVLEVVARAKATRKIETLEVGDTSPELSEEEANLFARGGGAASDSLRTLCLHCTDLKALDIHGVPGAITKDSVYTLSARLRKTLTTLDLGGSDLAETDTLNPLNAMKANLTSLSLKNSPGLRDGVVHHFPVSLTKLDLSGLVELSDSAASSLAKTCPNLMELKLDGCTSVTDAFLEPFKATRLAVDSDDDSSIGDDGSTAAIGMRSRTREAPLRRVLERLTCAETGISDSGLQTLAQHTVDASSLTSGLSDDDVIVDGFSGKGLPCTLAAPPKARPTAVLLELLLVDLNPAAFGLALQETFLAALALAIDVPRARLAVTSIAAGSVAVTVRVSGLHRSGEAAALAASLTGSLEKASLRAQDHAGLGKCMCRSASVERHQPGKAHRSSSSVGGPEDEDDNSSVESEDGPAMRGLVPVPGAAAARARKRFYELCSAKDASAPRLQVWARRCLELKEAMKIFARDNEAASCIQRHWRTFKVKKFFNGIVAMRVKAARLVQKRFRDTAAARKVKARIAAHRERILMRAFGAMQEVCKLFAKRQVVATMAVRRRRRGVLLKQWRGAVTVAQEATSTRAAQQYVTYTLRKQVRAWRRIVDAVVARKKALAVVFLTAAADLSVHYNSERQLKIAPLGEQHWRQCFGPPHLRAWAMVALVKRINRNRTHKLVASLVKLWRPWAHDRVVWRARATQMEGFHARKMLKRWGLWIAEKERKRQQRRRAQKHYLRVMINKHFREIKVVCEAKLRLRREREALVFVRIVRPRQLRYQRVVFDDWFEWAAYKREGRVNATIIQRGVRLRQKRLREDVEKRKDAEDDRTAIAYWRKRKLPSNFAKWSKWALWRSKYHPAADLQAYYMPLRVVLPLWRKAAHEECAARNMERVVRGFVSRRKTHKYAVSRDWAAMTIGKAFKAAIFRRNLANIHKLRMNLMRLQDAARAMKELEKMEREDLASTSIEMNHRAALLIQGHYRVVLGKRMFRDKLVAMVLDRQRREREAQADAKRQALENARLRELERHRVIKAARMVQNAWRSKQARALLGLILAFNAKTKVTTLLQACYRGRIGRRIGFGQRRMRAIVLTVLRARQRESWILRSLGIKRRSYAGPLQLGQNTARWLLRAMDVSPATYTAWKVLKTDLREDFLDARHAVLCRLELAATDGIIEAWNVRMPKRVENKFNVISGSAVQVIHEGHKLHGMTGYCLSVDRSDAKVEVAEVRMDNDQAVHFIPIKTEESTFLPAEQVLITVPIMEFKVMAKLGKKGFRNRWRNDLIAYSLSLQEADRTGRKARTLQCAYRQYRARVLATRLRDEAGIANAVRCQRTGRTLKRLGIYHQHGAWLISAWYWVYYNQYRPHMPGIRVPDDLPLRPTRAMKRADEHKRRQWRKLEVEELVAYFKRQSEYFGGKPKEVDRLAAKGVPEDDMPLNLKIQMPFRRWWYIRRALWRVLYYKQNRLVSHHAGKGVSGGANLEAGYRGDGWASQPLGLKAHENVLGHILGRDSKKGSAKRDHKGKGKWALAVRHHLVTAVRPSEGDNGEETTAEEFVTAPNGAVFRRAVNLPGTEKVQVARLKKEAARELKSTGIAAMELAQLKTLPFSTNDGWALVHGVYHKGVPDGWSVVHPLTGNRPEQALKGGAAIFKTAADRWTSDSSLEMAMAKEMRLKRIYKRSADVRKALQVEIRQLRLEDIRLREGRIKYEARTKPVRQVEDELLTACTRLQQTELAMARELQPAVGREEESVLPYCVAMERVAAANHRVRCILRRKAPETHPPWPTEGKCADSDEDESLTKEPLKVPKKAPQDLASSMGLTAKQKVAMAKVKRAAREQGKEERQLAKQRAELEAAEFSGSEDDDDENNSTKRRAAVAKKSKVEESDEEEEEAELDPYNEAADVAESQARAEQWAAHSGPYLLECFDDFGLACGASSAEPKDDDDSEEDESNDNEDDGEENNGEEDGSIDVDDDDGAGGSAASASGAATSVEGGKAAGAADESGGDAEKKKATLRPSLRCSAYPVLVAGATRFGRSRKLLTQLTKANGGSHRRPKSIHHRLFMWPSPEDDEDEEDKEDEQAKRLAEYDAAFSSTKAAKAAAAEAAKEAKKAVLALARDDELEPYHFKIVGKGRGKFKIVARPGATCYLEGRLVSVAGQGRTQPLWDGARITVGRVGATARTFIFRDNPAFYAPVPKKKPVVRRSPAEVPATDAPPQPSPEENKDKPAAAAEAQPAAAAAAAGTAEAKSNGPESDWEIPDADDEVQAVVLPPRIVPPEPGGPPPAWVRCERLLNPAPPPPPPMPAAGVTEVPAAEVEVALAEAKSEPSAAASGAAAGAAEAKGEGKPEASAEDKEAKDGGEGKEGGAEEDSESKEEAESAAHEANTKSK